MLIIEIRSVLFLLTVFRCKKHIREIIETGQAVFYTAAHWSVAGRQRRTGEKGWGGTQGP